MLIYARKKEGSSRKGSQRSEMNGSRSGREIQKSRWGRKLKLEPGEQGTTLEGGESAGRDRPERKGIFKKDLFALEGRGLLASGGENQEPPSFRRAAQEIDSTIWGREKKSEFL